MPDFNVRADSVNVEQIMEQIRARIREKRGVDYTEQQIRDLAAVKLEKFLDPRGVRSDLLEQFRKAQPAYNPPELPNYAFEDQTLFDSTRAPLRWLRKLLNPILKLFFNPNPLIQALNIQSRLNTMYGEREARREATRRAFDQLQYELMHNLVIETTRLSIEVKNLKMRVESLTGRLEFNERRARALESVVVYKPSAEERVETAPVSTPATREPAPAAPPGSSSRESSQGRPDPNRPQHQQHQPVAGQPSGQPSAPGQPGEGPGQRSRRRRSRRGRRGGGGSAQQLMGGQSQGQSPSPLMEAQTAGNPTEGSPISSGSPAPHADTDVDVDSDFDDQDAPDSSARETSEAPAEATTASTRDDHPSTRDDQGALSGPDPSTRDDQRARSEPDDTQ